MPIKAIFANVSCSDLAASRDWFEKLFGRAADVSPMPGLNEWNFGETAALQLFEDAKKAGSSTLTLIVDDLEAERRRIVAAGLSAGEIEGADYTSIARLSDPDGNLVVLAQPKR